MTSYYTSLRYALDGLFRAFGTERNLQSFGAVYVLSMLLGWFLGLSAREWETVIFTGAVFLSIELLNTALEHFTDAFDLHSKSIHTSAIKATKDIAAGASLVCATAWGVILLMIFLPQIY